MRAYACNILSIQEHLLKVILPYPPKVNCHPTKQSCQYTAAQSKLNKEHASRIRDPQYHTQIAPCTEAIKQCWHTPLKFSTLKSIVSKSYSHTHQHRHPTKHNCEYTTKTHPDNTQSPDARHTRAICSCFLSSMARGIARNTLVVKSDCFKSSIRTSDGSIEGLRVIARRV